MQHGILFFFFYKPQKIIITIRRNAFRKITPTTLLPVHRKGSSDERFNTGLHVSNSVVTESVVTVVTSQMRLTLTRVDCEDTGCVIDETEKMITSCNLLGFYYYRIYTILLKSSLKSNIKMIFCYCN